MRYYVKFKAVEIWIPKIAYYLAGLSGICLIVLIVTGFVPSVHSLQRYAAVGLVLGVLIVMFLPKHKDLGECVLSDSEIIMANKNSIERYPLSGVTKVKIFYSSYAGQGSGRSINEGTFNSITFQYAGKTITTNLMFLRGHITAMNVLFKIWQENNIHYELNNGKRFLKE